MLIDDKLAARRGLYLMYHYTELFGISRKWRCIGALLPSPIRRQRIALLNELIQQNGRNGGIRTHDLSLPKRAR